MSKHHINGKNLFWFFLAALLVLIVSIFLDFSKAHAEFLTHPNITLYQITTDEQVTIGWDDTNTDLQDYFDFYLWNRGENKKYLIGDTQQLQVTIYLPRTGLWEFYCRACNLPDTDPNRECSDYAASLAVDADGLPYGQVEDPNNPGTYIQGKWLIYGHVAPPTGGGVDTTP